MQTKREVIDVDEDLDILCTGVRYYIRTDRPQNRKCAHPLTIFPVDSDTEYDGDSLVASSSRSALPSHSNSISPPPSYRTELQRITQLELSSRRALCDDRPAKKRATDALKMAQNAINHNLDLKRKERSPEVIEISSDSEPEALPPKRPKIDEYAEPSNKTDPTRSDVLKLEADSSSAVLCSPIPSDWGHSDNEEEDDCIDFLATLDISNESNWISLPERNKAEDLTPIHELDSKLPKPLPQPPFYQNRKKPPVNPKRVPLDWDFLGSWGLISKICPTTKFPKPFYYSRRRENLFSRRSPSLYYEKGYTKLQLTAKYPHLTSGSVNKIIQAQDTVVLCAAVTGGLDGSDEDEDDQSPPASDNKLGSLIVYHHGQVHMAPAHYRRCKTSHGTVMKYYTVNDIVFNPLNPRQFLSSGCDHVVQAWQILDHEDSDEREGLSVIRNLKFNCRPQDLLYAPDGSALAITCYDGTVRLDSQDPFEEMMDADFPREKFRVAPKLSDHATGSTLWGRGPSEHLLFTSSEPRDKNDFSGFHYAFDICKGVQAIRFNATEGGDAAAISPDGTTLVLFTWGKDRSHPIRLYDVRRKNKEAYEAEELEKFQVRPHINSDGEPGDSEEVNQASFSPDGRLLAVARNDNALHIYDVRALSRGPLCRFVHHDSDTVRGGEFGVVGATWIKGRERIGIVSGGDDGCVRLWEPALESTDHVQGAVIGRTDFDVGHFSVGDRQNREFPLVMGDSGGGIHTYDFTNEDGIRI